jgi:hypothetical protein
VPLDEPTSWASFVATFAPLPVVVYFVVKLWQLLRPMTLLFRGEYADARRGFEKTTDFWISSAARASRYNVALCLELEGKLEEAESKLRALMRESLDPRLTYATRSLLGTILILRDISPHEAREILDLAQKDVPTPLGALLLAHAHLALGDRGGAARLVADSITMAGAPPRLLGWKASLRFEPRLQSSIEAFFRGWYFHKAGERANSRAELERAAATPLPHVCAQRARAILAAYSKHSIDLEDVPSSLSPHEFD